MFNLNDHLPWIYPHSHPCGPYYCGSTKFDCFEEFVDNFINHIQNNQGDILMEI